MTYIPHVVSGKMVVLILHFNMETDIKMLQSGVLTIPASSKEAGIATEW